MRATNYLRVAGGKDKVIKGRSDIPYMPETPLRRAVDLARRDENPARAPWLLRRAGSMARRLAPQRRWHRHGAWYAEQGLEYLERMRPGILSGQVTAKSLWAAARPARAPRERRRRFKRDPRAQRIFREIYNLLQAEGLNIWEADSANFLDPFGTSFQKAAAPPGVLPPHASLNLASYDRVKDWLTEVRDAHAMALERLGAQRPPEAAIKPERRMHLSYTPLVRGLRQVERGDVDTRPPALRHRKIAREKNPVIARAAWHREAIDASNQALKLLGRYRPSLAAGAPLFAGLYAQAGQAGEIRPEEVSPRRKQFLRRAVGALAGTAGTASAGAALGHGVAGAIAAIVVGTAGMAHAQRALPTQAERLAKDLQAMLARERFYLVTPEAEEMGFKPRGRVVRPRALAPGQQGIEGHALTPEQGAHNQQVAARLIQKLEQLRDAHIEANARWTRAHPESFK